MRGNTIIPSGWIRKAGWQEMRGNNIITYNTKRLECEGGVGRLGGGGGYRQSLFEALNHKTEHRPMS